jgi:hypothetical protein
MPCSLCEQYFIYNPCTDYNRIPKPIQEHIKGLKWYNRLKQDCPCVKCIVGSMCGATQSLKCEIYSNITKHDMKNRGFALHINVDGDLHLGDLI